MIEEEARRARREQELLQAASAILVRPFHATVVRRDETREKWDGRVEPGGGGGMVVVAAAGESWSASVFASNCTLFIMDFKN